MSRKGGTRNKVRFVDDYFLRNFLPMLKGEKKEGKESYSCSTHQRKKIKKRKKEGEQKNDLFEQLEEGELRPVRQRGERA